MCRCRPKTQHALQRHQLRCDDDRTIAIYFFLTPNWHGGEPCLASASMWAKIMPKCISPNRSGRRRQPEAFLCVSQESLPHNHSPHHICLHITLTPLLLTKQARDIVGRGAIPHHVCKHVQHPIVQDNSISSYHLRSYFDPCTIHPGLCFQKERMR